MKKNETNQALTIHCKCNYFHMLMGTYNMALSCYFQRDYHKNISYPIIIKGNLKEVGSKFIIKRPDLNLYIFFEIKDIITTDYYAFFKYHAYKTIPDSYEYFLILEVRYINEDQCDFFSCFIFDHKIYLSEKEMYEEIQFRKKLYKNMEKSLRNFEILKITGVYTKIDSSIELIFDILKNMKMIHKYSRLLGDYIDYDGNILKKNCTIYLKDFRGKEVLESVAKVHKLVLTDSKITKEGNIEILFKNDKKSISDFSKTKIMIYIYEYNGCSSIYILYFFYNIQKNKEHFLNFTKKKSLQLFKFKKIIENYNKKVYNIFSKE